MDLNRFIAHEYTKKPFNNKIELKVISEYYEDYDII